MPIKREQLEGSKAMATFLREYADLMEKGWARPFTAHHEKSQILVDTDDSGTVRGGIVFDLNRITKTGWIVFSFTVPAFRKMGVYTGLHARLEKELKEEGMTNLASHVHVDNVIRQKSCHSIGMTPQYYRMDKQL